jgi:hypothetical protein
MKTLGYIVTDRKLKDIDGFVEQVNDISLADSTKPILIVGWKNAKNCDGYTSILEKQLGNNIYWTFSKSESRSDFEEDLQMFYNIIYNNILNNINYYYINIFKLKYSIIKKLYSILFSKENKNIYISNGMMYIPHKGNVFGLSLNILEYCGIKTRKILDRIISSPNNKIIEDNDKFVFKLTKRLGNKKYAIPYFISS